MPDTIVVKRKRGPDWEFVDTPCVTTSGEEVSRWIHKTGKNTYRLFFDNEIGSVWIGVLANSWSDPCWAYAHDLVRPVSIKMCHGLYVFN